MMRFLPAAMALVAFAGPVRGDDVLRPVSERYAAADVQESPDFQKHVTPLLGRLGCNGRSCHGSFQGQGGFRLSLFGYDFKLDHEGLLGGDEPRTNLEKPAESLILQKPTMEIPHEGGERMKAGSWEYNILYRWVQSGAPNVAEKHAEFKGLEITPAEILFSKQAEKVQLKVIAVWSDGVREDVTPLCRFQSNSTQVAEITAEGLVTAVDPGDTHVVISYDTGVVPIPVIRPVSDQFGPKYPNVPTPTRVDELVVQKLRKLGIVQSDTAGDAEFLRRVSLDMTGTLPHPAEVEAFLSDVRSDKRSRKIDELLERPGYAAWWATRLCDITGNNDDNLNNVTPIRGKASQDWYDWIRDRVERNVPYDELVAGIVLGNSRNKDESYVDYCKNMSAIYSGKGQDAPTFAERDSMPHFWARANFRQPDDRAIGFAYTFMGIRIQCAQCHKHPFDQWTQDDFKQFTGFFTATRLGQAPDTRDDVEKMMKELGLESMRGNNLNRELPGLLSKGKIVPFQEVYTVSARGNDNTERRRPGGNNNNGRNPGPSARSAKLLGSEKLDLTKFDDPRQPLMDWLRSKDNRFFAHAFVNRVWANYFNVGIVNPPDDLSLANPPSNRALLDYLAQGFIENNFDMKWLHREICNSRTYQLSWAPNDTNRLDEVNFSHAIPRRIPAEVAYDALAMATASDEEFTRLQHEVGDRAISLAAAGRRRNTQGSSYALSIFGRSIRDTNCDCDRSADASLLQTVFMQNDDEVYRLISRGRTGWVDQAARELSGQVAPPASRDSAPVEVTAEKRPITADNLKRIEERIAALRKDGQNEQADRMQQRLKDLKKQQKPAASEEVVKPEAKPEEKKAEPTFAAADLDSLITRTYLRTLGRKPAEDELGRARSYVDSSEDASAGLKGLTWALLNTKEFIVNH